MPTTEKNTSDIRVLSDTELADVSGGIITHVYVAAIAGIIAGWDLAPGVTARNAATALGVEHLL